VIGRQVQFGPPPRLTIAENSLESAAHFQPNDFVALELAEQRSGPTQEPRAGSIEIVPQGPQEKCIRFRRLVPSGPAKYVMTQDDRIDLVRANEGSIVIVFSPLSLSSSLYSVLFPCFLDDHRTDPSHCS